MSFCALSLFKQGNKDWNIKGLPFTVVVFFPCSQENRDSGLVKMKWRAAGL